MIVLFKYVYHSLCHSCRVVFVVPAGYYSSISGSASNSSFRICYICFFLPSALDTNPEIAPNLHNRGPFGSDKEKTISTF